MCASSYETPTILIVSTVEEDRNALAEALELLKSARVLWASDVAEVFALLETESVTVVISDNEPGVLDGVMLCSMIRNSPAWSNIHTMMLMDWRSSSDRALSVEAGADEFLPRPIVPEEVRARIKTALRLKRLEAERSDFESRAAALESALDGLGDLRPGIDALSRELESLESQFWNQEVSGEQMADRLKLLRTMARQLGLVLTRVEALAPPATPRASGSAAAAAAAAFAESARSSIGEYAAPAMQASPEPEEAAPSYEEAPPVVAEANPGTQYNDIFGTGVSKHAPPPPVEQAVASGELNLDPTDSISDAHDPLPPKSKKAPDAKGAGGSTEFPSVDANWFGGGGNS